MGKADNQDDADNEKLRTACHNIYHKCVDGILSQEDTDFLEDTFMQTTKIYKKQDTSKPFNHTSSGKNVEKLQNIIVMRKPPARPVVQWSFSGEIDKALLSVKVMQSGRRITTERRSL